MSWGIETQGFFGRLPIDQDYKNLVLRKSGARAVGPGYQVISIEPGQGKSIIVAARHPGLDVAFLGHTFGSEGVTGIRVYIVGSGTFYWRSYEDSYPLPETGWGMVVYGPGGGQSFHSDHIYADVKNSRSYVGGSRIPLGGAYYLLNTPATPVFEYDSSSSYSIREDKSYQQTGTRRVLKPKRVYECWYKSGVVDGRFTSWRECGYVTKMVWIEEPVYGFVTVGYWVTLLSIVYCRKKLALVRHETSENVSEKTVVTHNWKPAWNFQSTTYNRSSPTYIGPDWMGVTFRPVYEKHLSSLRSPAYSEITGHKNKVVVIK